MKNIISRYTIFSLAGGLFTVVMAHTGHGHGEGSFSLLHYLMEPMHFGIILIGAVVFGIYWHKKIREC